MGEGVDFSFFKFLFAIWVMKLLIGPFSILAFRVGSIYGLDQSYVLSYRFGAGLSSVSFGIVSKKVIRFSLGGTDRLGILLG